MKDDGRAVDRLRMYGRIEDLLRLALSMQGSRTGLSLADISAEFGVSRSTAERMRDAVLRAFPQAELAPGSERIKRWRIPDALLNRLVDVDASELEELRLAADQLRREGLDARARIIDGIRAKLSALMTPVSQSRVAPDLEALIEAEGHAARPGPHPAMAEGVLATMRQALLECRVLHARYRRRIGGRLSAVELEPHGLLFGHRHYLVAFPAGAAGRVPKLYALGNLSSPELSSDFFQRRPDFDLRAYAAQSFGVFQEPATDVVWRFEPDLAADALDHHFHPTERKIRLEDGRVEVHFRAGGLLEMCWHLFTWGEGVEVVAPSALRERYQILLEAAQTSNARRPLGQVA